ncbi:type IV toxin-antitoxin system AbiEi family antitoxin domain-containing protein, partial [Caballeronia sp. M23-90]
MPPFLNSTECWRPLFSADLKRLFFFFADRHGHAWLKHIDRSKIGLGSGKRVLVKDGRLDFT